ncbi:sugar phosphate isomerase/epimerase [Burkholderia sp. Bp8990]|uniref:sugar phosphate isomerase/epimerase family protein n=1 Tax=Burkholderia sp. Bp8990 TaxID=2184552 RepID=UPI00162403CF|nr:sugar phosphate isomerase/epimerase [Burkholderia sp. Bp8990]
MRQERRRFIKQGAAAMAAFSVGLPALAGDKRPDGYSGPIGLQLYTLGDAVQQDPARVFAQLYEIGYREIEALTYANLTPSALRRHAANAGLLLRSAHLDFATTTDVSRVFDIANELGVTQVVSSMLPPVPQDVGAFIANTGSLTIDDFRRIAERAQRIGELARRAGLAYAYHNHNFEFRNLGGGVLGYDVLLRDTDPHFVRFEIDCGWMSFAGINPVEYLKRHGHRFHALHIKNFDMIGYSTSLDAASQDHITELGRGVIDYRPIVAAGLQRDVRYLFLEHDPRQGVPIPMDMVRREFEFFKSIV